MCLTVNKHYHKKGYSLVAKEDILVYKLLERRLYVYRTPFRRFLINFSNNGIFQYKKTKMGKVYILGAHLNSAEIEEGLHAYVFKSDARENKDDYANVLCRAVIPKGSRFFIGIHRDIVSNQLIVFKNIPALKKWANGKKLVEIEKYIRKWLS